MNKWCLVQLLGEQNAIMNEIVDREKSLDQRSPAKHHLAPVFVLLVLTPLVSELLLGDIGFNAGLPFFLLINMLYYGTGAILIREIVRRRGLHWSWIPVLAFAYGLIEEGLALHSLFNPHFPHIGSLGFYGRAFGVDWVCLVCFRAAYSMEHLCPDIADRATVS